MRVLLLGTVLLSACASNVNTQTRDPNVGTSTPEAKIVAQQNEASYVTEIKFGKASSDLSTEAKQALDNVLERANAAGKLEQVMVVSWADAEYPAEPKKKLPRAERELAHRRSQSVNTYLKSKMQKHVEVDTFNMAERPNAFERVLSTPDARIKRALENAGIATTAHDIRFPENASKTTVMLILDK